MNQDHYAILGVPANADTTAIRAAYIALMREYHPDRNPSPAAVIRAQAIGAAYKVLGDFDRRNEYDWDRRRARDKAATVLAARPKRAWSAAVVIVAALSLAVAGGMMLQPVPRPDRLPDVAMRVVPDEPQPPPMPRVAIADRVAVPIAPKPAPLPAMKLLPELYPEPPLDPALAEPVAPKVVKAKTMRRSVTKVVAPAASFSPKARPPATARPAPQAVAVAAVAKVPVKPPSAARPAPATDLAALDQFVMAFYGQSWRFGDTRKRSALEQSRTGFVERRGACLADACKRAAYLKLQREVSAIVASGTPDR